MFLSFKDLDFTPSQPPTHGLRAYTVHQPGPGCPTSGWRPAADRSSSLARVFCFSKPTQLEPPLAEAALWRLISHLSLNHLSLSEGQDSLHALREILLYSVADRPSIQQQIMGIRQMSAAV